MNPDDGEWKRRLAAPSHHLPLTYNLPAQGGTEVTEAEESTEGRRPEERRIEELGARS